MVDPMVASLSSSEQLSAPPSGSTKETLGAELGLKDEGLKLASVDGASMLEEDGDATASVSKECEAVTVGYDGGIQTDAVEVVKVDVKVDEAEKVLRVGTASEKEKVDLVPSDSKMDLDQLVVTKQQEEATTKEEPETTQQPTSETSHHPLPPRLDIQATARPFADTTPSSLEPTESNYGSLQRSLSTQQRQSRNSTSLDHRSSFGLTSPITPPSAYQSPTPSTIIQLHRISMMNTDRASLTGIPENDTNSLTRNNTSNTTSANARLTSNTLPRVTTRHARQPSVRSVRSTHSTRSVLSIFSSITGRRTRQRANSTSSIRSISPPSPPPYTESGPPPEYNEAFKPEDEDEWYEQYYGHDRKAKNLRKISVLIVNLDVLLNLCLFFLAFASLVEVGINAITVAIPVAFLVLSWMGRLGFMRDQPGSMFVYILIFGLRWLLDVGAIIFFAASNNTRSFEISPARVAISLPMLGIRAFYANMFPCTRLLDEDGVCPDAKVGGDTLNLFTVFAAMLFPHFLCLMLLIVHTIRLRQFLLVRRMERINSLNPLSTDWTTVGTANASLPPWAAAILLSSQASQFVNAMSRTFSSSGNAANNNNNGEAGPTSPSVAAAANTLVLTNNNGNVEVVVLAPELMVPPEPAPLPMALTPGAVPPQAAAAGPAVASVPTLVAPRLSTGPSISPRRSSLMGPRSLRTQPTPVNQDTPNNNSSTLNAPSTTPAPATSTSTAIADPLLSDPQTPPPPLTPLASAAASSASSPAGSEADDWASEVFAAAHIGDESTENTTVAGGASS
ncbi:hypothetical protein HK102_007940 [Quaeritorhiza haematococci]|nr:hypothetical protein HK102_007940 [Quaeritorhiza haematococci]